MILIADIPFKLFNFRGLICILIVDDKEFKFTTYNNAKIIEYKVDDNVINIVLKKGHYYLYLNAKYNDGLTLYAPVSGKMKKDILESISSSITVTLKNDKKVIFSSTSTNCGLEIVNE